jgi:hypothetical protein
MISALAVVPVIIKAGAPSAIPRAMIFNMDRDMNVSRRALRGCRHRCRRFITHAVIMPNVI